MAKQSILSRCDQHQSHQQAIGQSWMASLILNWLVVWLPFFIFPWILGMSSSHLTNSIIFQRGGPGPPTSYRLFSINGMMITPQKHRRIGMVRVHRVHHDFLQKIIPFGIYRISPPMFFLGKDPQRLAKQDLAGPRVDLCQLPSLGHCWRTGDGGFPKRRAAILPFEGSWCDKQMQSMWRSPWNGRYPKMAGWFLIESSLHGWWLGVALWRNGNPHVDLFFWGKNMNL